MQEHVGMETVAYTHADPSAEALKMWNNGLDTLVVVAIDITLVSTG